MASATEEEVDYESDPEEAKRSLTMRRREASDDEEERGDGADRERIDTRAAIESDGESEGRGAPAEYDDEESEVEEEELEEEEDEEYEEEVEVEVEVEVEEEYEGSGGKGGSGIDGGDEVEAVAAAAAKELGGERGRSVGETTEEVGEGNPVEGEKKENEPFAVPTAGAFYMHDDRFRDNAGGRNRRTLGGRKLWESKDDKKWGHDKFEEMTLRDRPYEEGMGNSRGNFRARGKTQGADRGYPRGNKSKTYNNNNQNNGPKGVRGRGPRRYEPSKMNNIEAPPTQHRRGYGKPTEKPLHTTSGRTPAPTSNVESGSVPARKQVVASSLSSASPPFYPSASSNKETTAMQKRDTQAGTMNRSLQSSIADENFSMSQSHTMKKGKNVVDSIGLEKLYNSASQTAGKPSNGLQLPPSGSSLVSTTHPLQQRAHGRGLAFSGQMTFQPGARHNLVSRVSPPTQPPTIQRSPAQSRVHPSSQASVQKLGQRPGPPGSGSQTSSPPKATPSINSYDSGELESLPESSKSKTALIGKGGVQGSGMSSFLYGAPQVMGASGKMGSGHGDQNFAATPAFLPVMPFGGQHPGGMGVPAVGMAFPGYVAQPQLGGLGNTEMTWLPVLAGAAGALGATYCSPYISVDGAYQARQLGPASSSGPSSKENDINKPNNDWKPSQRPEVASDEFGQRQKNTRRYTEMNFGQ